MTMSVKKNPRLVIAFLILLCAVVWHPLSASHVVGGEMRYKFLEERFLGGRKVAIYEISLALRRDSLRANSDAKFDTLARVGVFPLVDGEVTTNMFDHTRFINEIFYAQRFKNLKPPRFSLNLETVGECDRANSFYIEVPIPKDTLLDETIRSDCGFIGMEEIVKQVTYVFYIAVETNSRLNGFRVAYQRCCRNGSIQNIMAPDSIGATYFVDIKNVVWSKPAFRNSTPRFKNWAEIYICNQKDLTFDHSAIDDDGDSLSYKLYTPFSGLIISDPAAFPCNQLQYEQVPWRRPFSQSDMFGGIPFNIHPVTGQLSGRPVTDGQFLIGVLVEEWRNGQLLSTVYRDCQYNVRNCVVKPEPKFIVENDGCNGLTVQLINSSIISELDSIKFTWYLNYPDTSAKYKIKTNLDTLLFRYDKNGSYVIKLEAARKEGLQSMKECKEVFSDTISVFVNTLNPDLTFSLTNCDSTLSTIDVRITDKSTVDEKLDSIISRQYTVSQAGQPIPVQTVNGITFIRIQKNETVDIHYTITSLQGCSSDKSYSLRPGDFFPVQDYRYELVDCPTDTIMRVKFFNLSASLNPNATLLETRWLVGKDTFASLNAEIPIRIGKGRTRVSLISVFKESCEVKDTFSVDLNQLLPRADFDTKAVGCADNDSVDVNLYYLSGNDKGVQASSFHWKSVSAGSTQTSAGDSVIVKIPRDSSLVVRLAVRFANGCVDTLSKSPALGPFATIKLKDDIFNLCRGSQDTILLNYNKDWTYTWTPPDNISILNETTAVVTAADSNFIYQVKVTDGLCSDSARFSVISLNKGVKVAVDGPLTTCDGNVTLTATGKVGEFEYEWSSSADFNPVIATGTDKITRIFAGDTAVFYVRLKNDQCASLPDSIRITNESVRVGTPSPLTFCRADTSWIYVPNLNNSHNLTYTWSQDAHIVQSSGGNVLVGVGPGDNSDFWLYYNVSNQHGCTERDSLKVSVSENKNVNFDFTLKQCGDTEICFEFTSGYEGTIQWDFGDVGSVDTSSVTKPCFRYPAPGTYNVLLTNQDSLCPFKDVVKSVVVNPALQISELSDLTLCEGDTRSFQAAANIAGTAFVWCNSDGKQIATGPFYQAAFFSDTEIILKATDNNGCTDMDTVAVDVFLFNYSVDIKDSLCIDSESKISFVDNLTGEDYTYQWGPAECIVSGANTPEPVIKVMEGKSIQLILKNNKTGCVDTSIWPLKVTKRIQFSIDPINICEGFPDTLNLQIANPDQYSFVWSGNTVFRPNSGVQNPIIQPSGIVTVSVLVTEKSSGCFREDSVLVNVYPLPDVALDSDPELTIFEGKDIELFVTNPIRNAMYSWNTGNTTTSIVVSPTETSTFVVTVTDENGCTDSATISVSVKQAKCDESDIFIPNAFSPNNDGVNDIFRVRSNFIEEMEILIYNRWGQELFRTTTLDDGWDGTFKGEELAPDAYAYYLRVLCVNGEEYTKIGNVTLVK